jgi:hypothetical protein
MGKTAHIEAEVPDPPATLEIVSPKQEAGDETHTKSSKQPPKRT